MAVTVFFLTEEIGRCVKPRPQTVATVGVRSIDDQQALGLGQILFVVYPLAIELTLKSLWCILHVNGSHSHIHHLRKLFRELSNSVSDASRAHDEARLQWDNSQKAELVLVDFGTLDDFLEAMPMISSIFVTTRV